MNKKILLIIPALPKVRVTKKNKLRHQKVFTLPYLGVLYLAALTPKEYTVKIANEHITPIDFNEKADLVGITVMTPTAPRAYEISDEFRKRGIKTVLGGMHPTVMPTEALGHCDCVVRGEAEDIWPRLLDDFERNRLKRVYKADRQVDLSTLPFPRRGLIENEHNPFDGIQATRGCIYRCDFCSVHNVFGGPYRMRPVSSVIREIKALKGKILFFYDDNLLANKRWAKELLKAMIPLKKRWLSMATVNIAQDDELLRLARKSGCLGFFLGLESLDASNLKSHNKPQNISIDFSQAVRKIERFGLGVGAGSVYGFDHDTKAVFKKTLDFAVKNNLSILQVSPLVPYPGTELYKRFRREHRKLDKDWSKYDLVHPTFTPKNMTQEELIAGMAYVRKGFYSWSSVIKRVAGNSLNFTPYSTVFNIFVNFAYRYNQRRGYMYPP